MNSKVAEKNNDDERGLLIMDNENSGYKKSRLLAVLIIALLLLYPFQAEIVPAWTIQFVDDAGAPWQGITVEEYWRDPRLQYREYRESSVTDNNGYVSFRRRTIWLPFVVRLIGSAVNALRVHGDRSTYVGVVPQGNFVGSSPNEFYITEVSLPAKMTLRCGTAQECK